LVEAQIFKLKMARARDTRQRLLL